jgi:hypothetical protein
MSEDFNPNSFNTVLGRILEKQEAMCDKMDDNHTEILERMNAVKARLVAHEAVDDKRHEDNLERLRGLEQFKWKSIGIISGLVMAWEAAKFFFKGQHKP